MIEWLLSLFAARGCPDTRVFGIPTWHEYLDGSMVQGKCDIQFNSIYDFYKILAAFIEIALRLGVLIAVGFIIWGGFKFITSQGDPNGIAQARDTIIHGVIGFFITMSATLIVSFVAARF